jgi:hypothetical protein
MMIRKTATGKRAQFGSYEVPLAAKTLCRLDWRLSHDLGSPGRSVVGLGAIKSGLRTPVSP